MINAASRGKGWQRVLFFLASILSLYLLGSLGWQKIANVKIIPAMYANMVIFALAALITVPLFRRFADCRSLRSLGFEWKGSAEYALIGGLFAVALLGTGSLMLVLAGAIRFEVAGLTFEAFISAFILMAIVAIAEESVFRGYILSNLLSSFSPWIALVISALLFAVVHAGNPAVSMLALCNVFVAGLLLGINYIYTQNLVFAVIFHFFWNFLQGPVLGFEVSGLQLESVLQANVHGNVWLTGGSFGFEASAIQTTLLAVATGILAKWHGQQFSQIKNPGQKPGL